MYVALLISFDFERTHDRWHYYTYWELTNLTWQWMEVAFIKIVVEAFYIEMCSCNLNRWHTVLSQLAMAIWILVNGLHRSSSTLIKMLVLHQACISGRNSLSILSTGVGNFLFKTRTRIHATPDFVLIWLHCFSLR